MLLLKNAQFDESNNSGSTLSALNEKSEFFCPLPWMHLLINTNGDYRPCCVAQSALKDANKIKFNILNQTVEQVWNSAEMVEMRRNLYDGKKSSFCNSCYYQESLGRKFSHRKAMIENWLGSESPYKNQIEDIVQSSVQNDFKVAEMPMYFDLRLGNTCNLRCRMCDPYNSSAIAAEYKNIIKENKEFFRFVKVDDLDKLMKMKQWYNEPQFWQEIDKLLPYLKQIYITGGEPTLISAYEQLLSKCVDQHFANEITLQLNTNCTGVSDKLIALSTKFKQVEVGASIDGYQRVQEYIRFPSRWSDIDSSLRKLLSASEKIKVTVSTVVQLYNVINLPDLFYYVDGLMKTYPSNLRGISLQALEQPSELSFNLLPAEVRQEVAKRWQDSLVDLSVLAKSEPFADGAKAILNTLRTSNEVSQDKISDFLARTDYLDRSRNHFLSTEIPELWRALSPYR